MKKLDQSEKAKRYRRARVRYCAKRQTKKWKDRKKHSKSNARKISINKKRQLKKPYIPLPAPKEFSLIENTDKVLAYFEKARTMMKDGTNIELDISKVDSLTAPTIALMIASINDKNFLFDSHVHGNSPNKPELKKLFTESGFYDHVKTRGSFVPSKGNMLHKEVDRKVVSEIAKEATLTGTRHVFNNEKPFDPVYDTLVECMQNTNNHADLLSKGECYWWLYVYSDPNKKVTSYSFLDLGVGIFESIFVKNYWKRIIKKTRIHKNISLVDDLLSGKIGSRVDKDRAIRGKGIPQIVGHSKSKNVGKFFIIANDVKINLKTGGRDQLKHKLRGTFLYWELIN